MNYRKCFLTSMLPLLTVSSYALAEQGEDDDGNMMVGVFVASNQSIYVEGEDKTQLMPFFTGEWGNIYLQGPSLGYKLVETEQSMFSVALELDGLFTDDRDDSPLLSDMKSLDSVYLASFNYEYKTEFGELGFSIAADVGGGHGGYSAAASYSYPMMLGRWMISPEVKVEWESEEINQYYYGVTAEDVKPGRALYTPGAGVNWEVGLTAMYMFDMQHALMFRAGYEGYSKEVTDSPIVDEDYSYSIGLGYTYRF